MTHSKPSELVVPFLDFASMADTRQASRLTLGLIDDGVPETLVITDLLAAAQREVGERWFRNEWTVADEHLVTGVSTSALGALSNACEPPPPRGSVVVACAEGDWHSLAAHLFAEGLRSLGTAVAFLGASTPADHVDQFLGRHHFDALAISCNLPLFYPGVTSLATVAHQRGVPVIAGGRALSGLHHATALGADGWARDATDASEVLVRWRASPPQISTEPVQLDRGAVAVNAAATDIADLAFAQLERDLPTMAALDQRQRDRTLEDLVFIVQFAAAARFVDDPAVFITMLTWLDDLLWARHVPPGAVLGGLDALRPHVASVDEECAEMIDIGRRHLLG